MSPLELYNGLLKEVEAGRVRSFKCEEYPELIAFDYKEICKWENSWNEFNRRARGIVFAIVGDKVSLVANPIPKFPNLEEVGLDYLDDKEIESITEKEDGSLGIIFVWKDKIFIMTRGSFSSDQALLGQSLLSKYKLDPGLLQYKTLLTEIVGPSNKNVCRTKYPEDELILLAVRDNITGFDFPYNAIKGMAYHFRMKVTKSYEGWSKELYEKLKATEDLDFEGVVIKLKSGERLKVKSLGYCKLHYVLQGEITDKKAFEYWYAEKIKDPTFADLLVQIPDEYFKEIRSKMEAIQCEFINWHIHVYEEFNRTKLLKFSGYDRKYIAINHPEYRWMLGPVWEEWDRIKIDPFILKTFVIKKNRGEL